MDLGLSGKVVVVFGAAQGIGKAIANAFLAEGATVIATDRKPEVSSVGTRGVMLDVTDYDAVKTFADQVRQEFGHCDHAIFAVGMGSGKFGNPFWNLEPSEWPRILNVNLTGAVNCATAFAPAMAARKSGGIQFISSVAGQIGSQTDPPYSAAKAGLINFAQCAAKDLAPYGVRVNVICPGMVRTELNRTVWESWNSRQPEENRMTYEAWGESKIASVTPLRRWQEPDDIAAASLYLASDMSKNVTGQTINVDGGQVMHS